MNENKLLQYVLRETKDIGFSMGAFAMKDAIIESLIKAMQENPSLTLDGAIRVITSQTIDMKTYENKREASHGKSSNDDHGT